MRIRAASLSLVLLLVVAARTPAETAVVDAVRVQVLSPSLVRLEERGTHGFEDRSTFHVTTRAEREDVSVTIEETPDAKVVKTNRWQLRIPRPGDSIVGLEFRDLQGKLLYRCDGKERNSVWLPPPGKMSPAWAFADTPRIVPPAWGALPPPEQPSEHGETSGWDVSNNARDVYVFLPGGDYRKLRRDFLKLTGATPMPPLYAFGAWDSRYYPYTEETALAQIDGYRDRRIPLDVLVIDTDWRVGASHGYGVDTALFPDMGRFIRKAKENHVRLMYNDHPEPVAKTALAADELRYRHDGLASLLNMGIDVWWFDRNWHTHLHEPAPGIRKEVWGMRLYRDITQAKRPGLRPMIMANVDGIDNGRRNRPPNVAAHRFPIHWTGDTQNSLSFLQMGIENAVYCGVRALNPYISEDLTGHVGRPTVPDYIRWVQFGALSPIFRLHCTRGDVRVPWEYGSVAEAITRDCIEMRYRLLPVFYAAARRNYETGEPMLRRCDLEWPDHVEAARDDQYLLGDSILVAPIYRDEVRELPPEWFRTPAGEPGLRAQYFNNRELTGEPANEQVDATIDFLWTGHAPAARVQRDNFSARWVGTIGPIPGDSPLRLRATADDGVRVFLDGHIVIDEWRPQAERSFWATQTLRPGQTYELRVDYQQYGGDAVCRLEYDEASKDRKSKRTVWLPPGAWIDVWSGEVRRGPGAQVVSATLREIPLFVRAGSVVLLAPPMQHTGEKPWSPVTVDVYPTSTRRALATLYEDDGVSNDYQDGVFSKTSLRASVDAANNRVSVVVEPRRGNYGNETANRPWRVRVHPPTGWGKRSVKGVRVNRVATDHWTTLAPVGDAMPFSTTGGSPDGPVIEVSVPAQPVTKRVTVDIDFQGAAATLE